MGAWMCRRIDPAQVLFMGFDAAGKTTILYKLKLGEAGTTIPTIGFNVETVIIDGVEATIWDVGSRDKIRPLYRHYSANCSGVVYVIDCKDRDRLDESLDEFVQYCLLSEEMRGFVIMILANKQDLEGVVSPQEIEDAVKKRMEASKIGQIDRTVFVCPASAKTGEGLWEAFQCFVEQVELRKKNNLANGLISVDMEKWKTDARKDSEETGDHGIAKQVFKNPMNYLKSLLFY